MLLLVILALLAIVAPSESVTFTRASSPRCWP